MPEKSALVLLSGGQDSSTALFWAKKKFSTVTTLSFKYGQRHEVEIECARRIAHLAKVEHSILNVLALKEIGGSALTNTEQEIVQCVGQLPTSFVPGRNIIFLAMAGGWAKARNIQNIVIGVNAVDFSVGGDSKIFIRDLKGIHLIPIRKFVEDFSEGNYETLSINRKDWLPYWRKVTGRYKHKVDSKKCFRITLERGRQIEITEDHSLFTVDDNYDLCPIRGSELKIGSMLIAPISLEEVHPTKDLESFDLRGLAEFVDKKFPRSTKNWSSKHLQITDSSLKINYASSTAKLPLNFPITNAFLYVAGLWIAEGSFSWRIFFSNMLPKARRIINAFFQLYGGRIGTAKGAHPADFYIQGGKLFIYLFQYLDLSGKSIAGTKHLPKWFWSLSRKQKQYFLAGFWDGDGGRFAEQNGCALFVQKSKDLVRDLSLAFQSLGVYPTVYPLKHSEGLQCNLGGVRDAQSIASLPLQDEIKLKTAQKVALGVPRDSARGLWAPKAFWKIAVEKGRYSGIMGTLYRKMDKCDTTSRSQRHPLLRKIGMGYLLDTPLGFQRVKNIEEVHREFMYDLSVEGNENFYANGILVHNSGYPDCRGAFIQVMEETLREGLGSPIDIRTPLIHCSKADIWEMAEELGILDVIIHETHTCYEGMRISHPWGFGCGTCPACQIRQRGYEMFRKRTSVKS